jgi:hypothetical protein
MANLKRSMDLYADPSFKGKEAKEERIAGSKKGAFQRTFYGPECLNISIKDPTRS